MSSDSDQTWLDPHEAAERLNRTERQVYRYGKEGRVTTRRHGRRTQFLAADVEKLAAELGAADEPRSPKPPRLELMEPGAVLDSFNRYLESLEEKNRQIQELMYRLGQQDTELQRRLLPEDAESLRQRAEETDTLRQQLAAQQQQYEALRAQIERLPSWLRRALGLK